MKRLILLSAILLSMFTTAFSQESSLIVGVSGSFTGSGDLFGTTTTIGYEYSATPRFKIAFLYDLQTFSSIQSLNGYTVGDVAIYHTFDFAPGLALIKSDIFELNLYLGGYIRFYRNAYGTSNLSTGLSDFHAAKYYSVGYIVMPTFDLRLSDKFGIFLRLSLQNDTHGDITSTAGLGLKIKL